MSESNSLFGDSCAPTSHHSASKVFQTRIRPSIHSTSRIPDTYIKDEESLVSLVDVNIKPERDGYFGIPRSPDQTPNTAFDIFGEDHVSGRSIAEDCDDCMLVDRDDCSAEARQRWSQDSSTAFESDPRLPVVPDLIAAQRMLMERFRNRQRDGENRGGQDRAVLLGSTLAPPRAVSSKPIAIDDEEMEDHYSSMRHRDDDDSWMNAEASGGEENELANLTEMRDALKKRKILSKTEDIQLIKLNEKIEVRNRRERIAEREERVQDEELVQKSMFVQSDEEDVDAGASDEEEHGNQQSMDQQDAEELRVPQGVAHGMIGIVVGSAKKTGTKSAKRRRPTAKTAREVQKYRLEEERQKSSKKQARATTSKLNSRNKGRKAKPRQGATKNGKKYFKSHMKNTWAGPRGNSQEDLQTLLGNLLQSNFIEDRQNQEDFGDAPDINERTKSKQLEALQASAPDNYDTHKLRTDKVDLMKASRGFGHGKVTPCNGQWLLKGMTSSLHHHQLLAADWMVTRELGTEAPFGGLLADAMGMGKTLETLATMVGNPPSPDHIKKKIKATLLVLPSSAIKQWYDEIRTHVADKAFPLVLHYTAKKEVPLEALRTFDIVLTSYAEVRKSFPYPSQEDMIKFGSDGGFARWMEECKKITGDLHKMNWYRIVLDEAHAIKNFKSRTSVACQNLRGQYRWALSGTPIQNRLDELFPYFRFLRAPWTNDYEEFRDYFCDRDAPDSNARISVILSIVMLRRTMKDRILGRPIVELPQIYPETMFISFSKEEKVIYRVLEDRFRQNLNQHFENGTAQKNYSMFMVQLLRLRQCTAHPFLLESTIKESLGPSDLMRLKTELKKLSRQKQPIFEQISQWVEESKEQKDVAYDKGELARTPGEKTSFGKTEFGRFFRMGKFLESVGIADVAGRMQCKLCGDHPTDPYFLDCHHCYCCECLRNYMASEDERDGDQEFYECPEPDCRKLFFEGQPFEEALQEIEEETRSVSGGQATPHDVVAPGSSKWLSMCENDPQKYLLPSAKMIALKSQLLKWFHQSPNDKILIFTQFRLLVKIIAFICEGEGWGTVSFTGDMGQNQRYEAIKRFHEDPSAQIMIAGLKCGGQALNLTCANRVISIDLWWNHSVEQQAFGRVFRIGQKKETYVSRFVIQNSVDRRLLSMQADKFLAIDKAMQDTGHCTPTLSIEDLASLFGYLSRTKNGTFSVAPDYVDDEDDDNRQDQEMEDRADPSDDDAEDA